MVNPDCQASLFRRYVIQSCHCPPDGRWEGKKQPGTTPGTLILSKWTCMPENCCVKKQPCSLGPRTSKAFLMFWKVSRSQNLQRKYSQTPASLFLGQKQSCWCLWVLSLVLMLPVWAFCFAFPFLVYPFQRWSTSPTRMEKSWGWAS